MGPRDTTKAELLEWLGLNPAGLLCYGSFAAVIAMFFTSNMTADAVLAILGVALSIVACVIGMKRNSGVSDVTNAVKLVSYPFCVLIGIGGIVVHYLFFR